LVSLEEMRAERQARNQTLFREVNELIEHTNDLFGVTGEKMELVCECGGRECSSLVAITRAEYEAVRAEPRLFIVLPGHETLEGEPVIAQNNGFAVVEAFGPAARLAEESDPRAAQD
jgi:hypothetical protein